MSAENPAADKSINTNRRAFSSFRRGLSFCPIRIPEASMGKLIKTPTSESELTFRSAKKDAKVKTPEIVNIALMVARN